MVSHQVVWVWFAFGKHVLAVLNHFLFVELYPGLWRMTPAVCVRNLPQETRVRLTASSSPHTYPSWTLPLSSKKSSETFLHCHDLSRNHKVAFHWHWSALPAPMDASCLIPLACVDLCPGCVSAAYYLVLHLQGTGNQLQLSFGFPVPHPACSGTVSVFLWGSHQLKAVVLICPQCFLWYMRVSSTTL